MALNDYVHKGEFDRRVKLIEEKLKHIKDDALQRKIQEDYNDFIERLRQQRLDLENAIEVLDENTTQSIENIERDLTSYQQITDRINANFDANGDWAVEFDGSFIAPLSIHTSAIAVGQRSQQLSLYDINFEVPNYKNGYGILKCNKNVDSDSSFGIIVHYTLFESAATFKINYSDKNITSDDLHYIYAILPYTKLNDKYYARQTGDEYIATINISTSQKTVDWDTANNQFWVLLGTISRKFTSSNSDLDYRYYRKVDLTYGQTTINGRLITTGRIEGNRVYFDLDKGEIGGIVKFLDNGTYYDYQNYINSKIGSYNLNSNQSFVNAIGNLQEQIDGEIDSWFYTGVPTLLNEPASSWTTDDEKDKHLGDLYYDKNTGYGYRFMYDDDTLSSTYDTYFWTQIYDDALVEALRIANNAQATADGKLTIFSSRPTSDYKVGDLWNNAYYPSSTESSSNTYNNVLLVCIRDRQNNTFNILDWTPSDRAVATADEAKDKAFAVEAAANAELSAIKGGSTTIAGGMITSNLIELNNITFSSASGTTFDSNETYFINDNGIYKVVSNPVASNISNYYIPNNGTVNSGVSGLNQFPAFWAGGSEIKSAAVRLFRNDYASISTNSTPYSSSTSVYKNYIYVYDQSQQTYTNTIYPEYQAIKNYAESNSNSPLPNVFIDFDGISRFGDLYLIDGAVKWTPATDRIKLYNPNDNTDYVTLKYNNGALQVVRKDGGINDGTAGVYSDWISALGANSSGGGGGGGGINWADFWNELNTYPSEHYSGNTIIDIDYLPINKSTNSFYAPITAGTSGYFLKSNGSGSAPTWQQIYSWALQSTKPSYTKSEVGLSNVTNDAQIAKSVFSGAYQIMYSTAASTPTVLNPNTNGVKRFLSMKGTGSAGAAPSWSDIDNDDLPAIRLGESDVSGILPITKGGTGATNAANARSNLGTWSLVSDSYNTLMPANGTSNGWVKIGTANSDYGIIPSQSGGAGSGHNYLGTSTWYWKYAYIDQIYGYLNGNISGSSTSCSGNAATATTATYLGSSNKGSATNPIYLNAGTPTACTYSLSSTVNAGTANCLAYYNSSNQIDDSSISCDGTNITMPTSSLITSGYNASHKGIKLGDTYLNAISGNVIFQNNNAIRFGADDWDYNKWAGLKYDSTNKIIYLGLADGTIFTANTAQSGGTLALPGIQYFSVNGKRVIDAGDAWLRINENAAYSSGVYFGSNTVRTDGTLQVGSSGSKFYANSSGNGYFSGNVGFGTTSPAYKLDVNGTSYFNSTMKVTSTGTNRATFELISNGDYPVDLKLGRSDTAKWSLTARKSTEGDAFYIYSYVQSKDAFYIKNDNTLNIGIGTTSPSYKLDVAGDIKSSNNIRSIGAGEHYIEAQNSTTTQRILLNSASGICGLWSNGYVNSSNTFVSGGKWLIQRNQSNEVELTGTVKVNGNFYATGAVTALQSSSSDKRLKKNIKQFNATEIIEKLKPVQFEWNNKAKKYNSNFKDGKNYGLIAQDSDGIVDDLVFDLPDNSGYKGVRYEKLIPILLQAIKEQQNEINELKKKMSCL